jgi:putative transposase
MAAMFFVLRMGCQWKALTETGSCSSRAAPRRFHEWAAAGVWLVRWTSGLVAYDVLNGMAWEGLTSHGAMTTVPLGGNKVGKNPTDRGTVGTTRRVLSEGGGVPIGLAVAGDERHDFKMARETLARLPIARSGPTPETPQGRCLDTGDDDDEVLAWLAECGLTAHIRARRWVAERTHRRMHRFRRVLIRWDKHVRTALGCRQLAYASITYRQPGLLG